MAFKHYLEEEDDKPYFTTNSLGYYYDKMEGFAEKVEQAAKVLNVTKEEVEKNITAYIEQNKTELDQRLAQWDGKLKTFDSSVETLLTEWVDDGTLTHVIDSTLIDKKIAPVTAQLEETEAEARRKKEPEDLSERSLALLTGQGTVNLLSIPQSKSVTPDKTTFLNVVSSRNLFNKNLITAGGYYDGNTLVWTASTSISQSGFISVLPGDIVRVKNTGASGGTQYVFKKADGTIFTGGYTADTFGKVVDITVPDNAYSFSVALRTDSKESFQIVKNKAMPSTYTAYEVDDVTLSDQLKKAVKPEGITPNQTTFISQNASLNVFDKTKLRVGGYYDGTTFEWKELSSVSQSDFIDVVFADVLNIKNDRLIGGSNYVFKNAAGELFSGGYLSNASGFFQINVPANAVSFSISVHNTVIETFMIVKNQPLPSAYQPFSDSSILLSQSFKQAIQKETGISSPWNGKKAIFTGDSITWGYAPNTGAKIINNFAKQTSERLGMEFVNYGISSSTVAVRESEPTGRTPVVTRFNEMDDDADLVVVAVGTNDFQHNWTGLGTMESRSNFDYYGALHNLCAGLLEKYKSKQIVFLTPIKRSQAPHILPTDVNTNGKTLKEYGDIIKEVCNYYSIPVLDMYSESMINPHIATQKAEYIEDGTHPNEKGHTLMTNRLTGYLRQLA